MSRHSLILFFVYLLLDASLLYAQEPDEIDREISRLKKEIGRVQSQRKEERKLAERERREFKDYQKRTHDKITSISATTDSIKNQLEQIKQKNDSIAAELSSTQTAVHEQDLKRKQLQNVIHTAATELLNATKKLPPLVQQQYKGPISYLAGEIETGSIENTEALYRLMRIVQDLRTVTQEIQVVEGASPVEEVRGTVYHLRIGAVFEAVVDVEGKNAFIWTGFSEADGEAQWQKCTDANEAQSILSAVRMREGKTVPELVTLPFDSSAAATEDGQNER